MTRIMTLVEELAVQTRHGEHTGEPLLQMLATAIRADSGRTRGGAALPSERALMDAAAFALYEDIAGQIASQLNMATEIKPNRSPIINLLAWAAAWGSATERGDITDMQTIVATERLDGWADRIRNHFNRPVIKELTIPCPNCGQRHILNAAEEQVAALTATLYPDQEMRVDCAGCTAWWKGDQGLIDLARITATPLDVDAIRDARAIDTPEQVPTT